MADSSAAFCTAVVPLRRVALVGLCQKSTSSGKRPYGYWKSRDNVLRELRQYVEEQNQMPYMPTQTQLLQAGRSDLAGAIRRYGSWKQVADDAGLVLSSIARPRSLNLTLCTELKSGRMRPYMYWRDFENVRSEVEKYVTEGVLPTKGELEKMGRSDLVRAIGMHGGWKVVAERMGRGGKYGSEEYWKDFDNVKREMLVVVEKCGGKPGIAEVRKWGRKGLLSAVVRRHGGVRKVVERMELEEEKEKEEK